MLQYQIFAHCQNAIKNNNMNIKINKKTYKIKPANQLTIKEYLTYFTMIKPDSNYLEKLICYLCAITGLKYNHVADINIEYDDIRRIFAYIGDILQANEVPESRVFYHRKSGKTLYQKSVNWRSIGARKMLEDRKAETQIEQAVYLLAIYINGKYDAEKIEEIYHELQDYNAIEVLSFSIFFFKSLYSGKKQGGIFLKRLLKNRFTSIVKQSSK